MPAEAVASSANPAIPMAGLSERQHGFNLFIVGFLVLFLELACIRWFAAYVVFLQFFTNVVLIAAFLGMSCGCLAARKRQDWLGYFPFLAFGTMVAALATLYIYHKGPVSRSMSELKPHHRRFFSVPSTAIPT